MPHIGPQPRQHDRTQCKTLLGITRYGGSHHFGDLGVAGAVVIDQGHMTDFHHKVGRDGRQQLCAQVGGQWGVAQAECYQMDAVGVNDAAGMG